MAVAVQQSGQHIWQCVVCVISSPFCRSLTQLTCLQLVVGSLVGLAMHSYVDVRSTAGAALALALKHTPCLAPLVMPPFLSALSGVPLPTGAWTDPRASAEDCLEECLPLLLPAMGHMRDAGAMLALSPAGLHICSKCLV